MSANLQDEEKVLERIIELDDKDLSLKGIAEKLDRPVKEIRESVIFSPDISERLKKSALESKAFEMFEKCKNPNELVKNGFCDLETAEAMYDKYISFGGGETDPEEKEEKSKLATQVGLLGSRLAQLEMKVLNSSLLPETLECPQCGHEGKYAVALVCKRCEKVTLKSLEKYPKDSSVAEPISVVMDSKKDEEEKNKE